MTLQSRRKHLTTRPSIRTRRLTRRSGHLAAAALAIAGLVSPAAGLLHAGEASGWTARGPAVEKPVAAATQQMDDGARLRLTSKQPTSAEAESEPGNRLRWKSTSTQAQRATRISISPRSNSGVVQASAEFELLQAVEDAAPILAPPPGQTPAIETEILPEPELTPGPTIRSDGLFDQERQVPANAAPAAQPRYAQPDTTGPRSLEDRLNELDRPLDSSQMREGTPGSLDPLELPDSQPVDVDDHIPDLFPPDGPGTSPRPTEELPALPSPRPRTQTPSGRSNTDDAARARTEKEIEEECEVGIEKLRAERLAKWTKDSLSIDINGIAGKDFPFECERPDRVFAGRSWCEVTYLWKASALCHKPLYFEDKQLERYGHEHGPLTQPFVSGAHFFVTLPILPYKMGLRPPNECVYALGHYRPGDCAPYMIEPLGFTWRAGLYQAGAWVAGAAIIP